MDDFEELRRLLLSQEQGELRALREQLADKEKRAGEVASVLPQAVRLSRERSEELSRALEPAVQGSIKESLEKRPEFFVDLLHPIIGPVVRRSIAEALRGLLQGLNKTLEHTFSWQGLKWRFEALRTGRSFAEVVLLRSLIYRVEQLFLIHRETSLSLLHVTADQTLAQDSDMVAGMLSAIQDFARDSFKVGADAALEEFRIGELEVWIAPGRHAFLAAVIRGSPPRELRTTLEEAIDSVHIQRGAALAKFDGDASIFAPLRPELEACLRAQYREQEEERRPMMAWALLIGTASIMVAAGVVTLRNEGRWRDFLRRIEGEPGLAITSAHPSWLGDSRVIGLRDPLANDPGALARQAGIDPEDVRFEWKDYYALDAVSVRRRFEKRFGLPPKARLAVANGVVTLSGPAPYEWLERVRQQAALVPGVQSVVERELTVTYDPGLVLHRFTERFSPPGGVAARVEEGTLILEGKAPYEWLAPVRREAIKLPGITELREKDLIVVFDPKLVLQRFEGRFGLPDTVNASVQEGILALEGEASHGWLTRVRRGATEIPGIQSIAEQDLINLDQQAFQQSKSVIENAFVYFLINKDNFATEGFAALSRLPDELRRCQTAARRIGVDISVEVRGYADSVGPEAKNIDLSNRRALAVRDFLVTCGLDSAMFKPVAMGQPPPPPPGSRPLPEQADRRVGFAVLTQPLASRP